MKPSARPALRHKKTTSHKSTSASISSLKNLNLKDSVSRPMKNTFKWMQAKKDCWGYTEYKSEVVEN